MSESLPVKEKSSEEIKFCWVIMKLGFDTEVVELVMSRMIEGEEALTHPLVSFSCLSSVFLFLSFSLSLPCDSVFKFCWVILKLGFDTEVVELVMRWMIEGEEALNVCEAVAIKARDGFSRNAHGDDVRSDVRQIQIETILNKTTLALTQEERRGVGTGKEGGRERERGRRRRREESENKRRIQASLACSAMPFS